jgi:rRNA maturation endonuclease Nob1
MSRQWCPSCGGTDIQIKWFEWDEQRDWVNQCQDCGKLFVDEPTEQTNDSSV